MIHLHNSYESVQSRTLFVHLKVLWCSGIQILQLDGNMTTFFLESWSAMAPGLQSREDWENWFFESVNPGCSIGKLPLKPIPPMLRRRFSDLGKIAAASALPLVQPDASVPCVFASRHGDTGLTLSLLEGIAKREDMSPTGFSLAVHNAVSGVFSIARKDVSAVTAIAASDDLIISALIEAIGQLQTSEKVLCIVYDVPLPEIYRDSLESDPFPYACAMMLSRSSGTELCLTLSDSEQTDYNNSLPAEFRTEAIAFIRFLLNRTHHFYSGSTDVTWQLTMTRSKDS